MFRIRRTSDAHPYVGEATQGIGVGHFSGEIKMREGKTEKQFHALHAKIGQLSVT